MKPRVERWWEGETVGIKEFVGSDFVGNTVGLVGSRANCVYASKQHSGVTAPLKICLAPGTQGWVGLRHACVCKGADPFHLERIHWWMSGTAACIELAAKLGAKKIVAPNAKVPQKLIDTLVSAGIELVLA